jgi:hypothetical protein
VKEDLKEPLEAGEILGQRDEDGGFPRTWCCLFIDVVCTRGTSWDAEFQRGESWKRRGWEELPDMWEVLGVWVRKLPFL